MIENFGKGLIPDQEDYRDYKLTPVAGLGIKVDWEKGFKLPTPPDANQGTSDACVSYAFSYYHWQLKGKLFSKRDLFSRIALQYGAELREGAKALVDSGQADITEVPDPANPTPQNMRDKSGTKESYRTDDREASFFSVPLDIESFAYYLQAYKGLIAGVYGDYQGWNDVENPRPPKAREWAHGLYFYGYGRMRGSQGIYAKSSWGTGDHFITEDYFKANQVMTGWCVIPKGQEPQAQIFNVKGTLGVAASNPETFMKLLDAVNIPYKLNSDNSLDFNSITVNRTI